MSDGEPPSEPIRFLCRDADADTVTPPTTAGDALSDARRVDPTLHRASRTDPRVFDAASRGWCLYPPETVTLEPASEPRVTPESAIESGYVTVDEDRSTAETLSATLDTRWYVEVDEGYPVLVTSWTGTFDTGVVPRLVTAADGATKLDVPLAVDEPATVDESTPIAQVVALPNALLEESFECGVMDDRRRKRVATIDRMLQAYDPYARKYRREKSPSELTGTDRLER